MYEDNDEDSSDEDISNDNSENLTSINNSTKNNVGDTAKYKKIKKLMSGYKLMKQMEDQRDSGYNYSMQKSSLLNAQQNVSQSINFSMQKRPLSKSKSTEALEKSSETNKEILFIQQTTHDGKTEIAGVQW